MLLYQSQICSSLENCLTWDIAAPMHLTILDGIQQRVQRLILDDNPKQQPNLHTALDGVQQRAQRHLGRQPEQQPNLHTKFDRVQQRVQTLTGDDNPKNQSDLHSLLHCQGIVYLTTIQSPERMAGHLQALSQPVYRTDMNSTAIMVCPLPWVCGAYEQPTTKANLFNCMWLWNKFLDFDECPDNLFVD